jgi:hypothetical protein
LLIACVRAKKQSRKKHSEFATAQICDFFFLFLKTQKICFVDSSKQNGTDMRFSLRFKPVDFDRFKQPSKQTASEHRRLPQSFAHRKTVRLPLPNAL